MQRGETIQHAKGVAKKKKEVQGVYSVTLPCKITKTSIAIYLFPKQTLPNWMERKSMYILKAIKFCVPKEII